LLWFRRIREAVNSHEEILQISAVLIGLRNFFKDLPAMIALRRVKNTERIPIVSGDHKGPPASLWRCGIIDHIVGMAPDEDNNTMFHLGTT